MSQLLELQVDYTHENNVCVALCFFCSFSIASCNNSHSNYTMHISSYLYSCLCLNPYLLVDTQKYGLLLWVLAELVPGQGTNWWTHESMGYGLSQVWVETEVTVIRRPCAFARV